MYRSVIACSLGILFSVLRPALAAPGDYGWYDATRPAWLDQNLTSSNGNFSVWYCDNTHHSAPYAGTADTDTDGLPDSWESDHIGDLASGAAGDDDADGQSNLTEYQDGSWPEVNFFRPADTIDSTLNGAGENVIARDVVDTLLFLEGKYSEWGFNSPYGLPLGIFIRYTPWGGWGNVDPIWIGSHRYTNLADPDRRSTATHELFHNVQRAYPDVPKDTDWFIEGSARMSQDFFYLDADQRGDTRYCGEIEGFLGDPEATNLFSRSYSAVFFWKYLVEQTGYSIAGQPWGGFDAMDRFMAAARDKEGRDAVEAYLKDLPHDHEWYGASFDHFFGTWITALYTRRFSPASLTKRYYYADEQENLPDTLLRPIDIRNAAYSAATDSYTPQAIPLNAAVLHDDDDATTWTQQLRKWRGRYYAFKPDPSARFVVVWADGKTSQRNYYAVVSSRANNVRNVWFNYGEDLRRAFYNDALDEVGVVVGALNDTADYDVMVWSVSEFRIDIVWPTTTEKEPVRVIDPGDPPATFEVHVSVRAYKENSPDDDDYVDGLPPDLFRVQVGAEEARVISGHQLGAQYWLVCEAPDLPENLYDLTVTLLDQFDIERQALSYVEKPHVDRMIVIDRSGSMGSDLMGNNEKMMAAKSGGRLHTDLLTLDDQVGLVSFGGDFNGTEDDATLHRSLSPATDGYKEQVKNSIDGDMPDDPKPYEHTAMGQGIKMAQEQLVARGEARNDWRIALLTDGLEDVPPFWDSASVSGIVVNSKTMIDAIALGSGAHEGFLRRISRETGGDYYYVPVPVSPSPAPRTLASGVDPVVENDVANIYRQINEKEMSYTRIWSQAGTVDGAAEMGFTTYDGMADLILTVNWPSVYAPNVRLEDSGGGVLPPRYISKTHVLYHVPAVNQKWAIILTSGEPIPYLAVLTGKGEILSKLFVTQPDGSETIGAVQKICFSLQRRGSAVSGANVSARITAPSGRVSQLALFDNGDHGDITAGDGIYSRDYRLTPWPGTYHVQATAAGQDKDIPYRIEGNHYFLMQFNQESDDRDQDGMPTEWEIRYGLDPGKADDTRDRDQDGLSNGDEFRNGGNPADEDTDNGGSQDRSELSNGFDMLDFADDLIAPPSSFCANRQPTDAVDPDFQVPRSGQNLLYWSLGKNYRSVDLYRGTSPTGPFTLIDSNLDASKRPYVDEGLVNHVPYYYRMAAETAAGIRTRLSEVIPGTPKADNLQPWGHVEILGPEVVADVTVTLRLHATTDTTLMRVANESRFLGRPWESFKTKKVWAIAGREGINRVYVQFRDGEDNLSLVVSDAVSYQDDSDGDGLGDAWERFWFLNLRHIAGDDDDGDGLTNGKEFDLGLNPRNADTDGDGMDDRYERDHGFNPLLDDGRWDADGDGGNNNHERIAGTNPRDRNDVFDIRGVSTPGGGKTRLEWRSVTGRLYTVFSAPTLSGESWTEHPSFQNMPGDGSSIVITTTVPASVNGYYRIGVRQAREDK